MMGVSFVGDAAPANMSPTQLQRFVRHIRDSPKGALEGVIGYAAPVTTTGSVGAHITHIQPDIMVSITPQTKDIMRLVSRMHRQGFQYSITPSMARQVQSVSQFVAAATSPFMGQPHDAPGVRL